MIPKVRRTGRSLLLTSIHEPGSRGRRAWGERRFLRVLGCCRRSPPQTVFGDEFDTAFTTRRARGGWLPSGAVGRYKPQVVVSVLVVAVLLGGAYYSSRASEATPRVVYSTALDEAVAEAQAPLLLNVNTAEAEDLEDLPEVGPSTAQSIVEYRESNGSFRS
ncbi:MAG: hypothetical protein CYG60_05885, partial [Actinobacteria bacterium]